MTNIELMMQQIEIKQKLIKHKIHQMKVETEQQLLYLVKDDAYWASSCAERVIRYGNEINAIKAEVEALELVIHLLSKESE